MTIDSFGFAAPFAAGSTGADFTSLKSSVFVSSGLSTPVCVTAGSIDQPSGSSALTVKSWSSADWFVTFIVNAPSKSAALDLAYACGTMSTSIAIVFEALPFLPVTVNDVLPRLSPAGPVTSKPYGFFSTVQPFGGSTEYSNLPGCATSTRTGSPPTLRT